MNKQRFATKILDWYEENKRDLPWRKTKDPYKIWLSEIMLQQTRVSQGLPYYENFLKNFSSVKKLADAPEKTVLRLWQGLGYYSRARNLHASAKIVASQFNGRFPNKYSELIQLPGIGEYTAAAISSIAFNEKQAVVDGNVFRVLSRIFGIDKNIASPDGKKYFFGLANELIPALEPGLFNQAVMEFGALHCTPKNPACDTCIFKKNCAAFHNESQHLYPIKSKPAQRRKRYFHYLVIRNNGKIWMRERNQKDIWNGLHEFYLIEKSKPMRDAIALENFKTDLKINRAEIRKGIQLKQILSHQEIHGKFFELNLLNTSFPVKGGKYYSLRDIDKLAKPVLITKYLETIK